MTVESVIIAADLLLPAPAPVRRRLAAVLEARLAVVRDQRERAASIGLDTTTADQHIAELEAQLAREVGRG